MLPIVKKSITNGLLTAERVGRAVVGITTIVVATALTPTAASASEGAQEIASAATAPVLLMTADIDDVQVWSRGHRSHSSHRSHRSHHSHYSSRR